MEQAAFVEQKTTQAPLEFQTLRTSLKTGTRGIAYDRYQRMLAQQGLSSGLDTPPRRAVFWGGSSGRQPTAFEKMIGNWLVAPFFLFSSLLVILFVPEKLVKKITAPFSGVAFWIKFGKRAFDFFMAVLGFIFCSILFLFVPVLIRADSPGSVFYQQLRVGMNYRRRDRRQVSIAVKQDRRRGERRKKDLYGRPFHVYKFRTMRQDAEKHSGAVWAQKNDPRVTRIGNILRFTHIDEIPQFLNVLFGDMSMVGPRPERPQIISKLISKVTDYTRRLQVKPGMTGIAQIYCGYDETIEDVREKVRYDLLYVNNRSLKADLLILIQTLIMIIRGRESAG